MHTEGRQSGVCTQRGDRAVCARRGETEWCVHTEGRQSGVCTQRGDRVVCAHRGETEWCVHRGKTEMCKYFVFLHALFADAIISYATQVRCWSVGSEGAW